MAASGKRCGTASKRLQLTTKVHFETLHNRIATLVRLLSPPRSFPFARATYFLFVRSICPSPPRPISRSANPTAVLLNSMGSKDDQFVGAMFLSPAPAGAPRPAKVLFIGACPPRAPQGPKHTSSSTPSRLTSNAWKMRATTESGGAAAFACGDIGALLRCGRGCGA